MISATISASDKFFKSSTGPAAHFLSLKKSLFIRILSMLTGMERKRFCLLAVSDVIISCVDVLSLAFLLCIIQFYIQPSQLRLLSFLPPWLINRESVNLIAIFFFLFTIKNLLAFFITRAQNNFIAATAVRFSKNNLIAYQQGTFGHFVNIDSSVHIRRTALQPFEFCQYLLLGIQQIITQISLIIISIAAILVFNASLFVLLLLILLPPVAVMFFFIRRRLSHHKRQIKSSNQKSFQYLMDALKGYVEANVYDKNNFFLNRFVDYRKKYSSHLFNSITIQTLPGRLVEIFAIMGLFALIVIASWGGVNDSKVLITIGAFMAAAYKIIPGMVKLINIASQVKAHEFSLLDIADVKKETKENELQLESKIESIQFSNVSFNYDGLQVLNNLSFSAEKGDFIGVAGKSGKGKTTILNMFLGFLIPSDGKIQINGEAHSDEGLKNFWPSISYVRQQSFFIHDTILQNITLEENDWDDERMHFALQTSGLSDFINELSEGVYKIITENGKNISGGQRQRISLARAFYRNADLFLLDEPFNELDETSEIILLNHLQQLANNGKIIVMVTHNKKALSFCNKTISLDD
jgi:ABC-type bacteriocin/lantibiotic exporter with double-glycine peptidase domain